jgi:hypothetical protein
MLHPEPLTEKIADLVVFIVYSKGYQIFIHCAVAACLTTIASMFYL